MADCNGCGACCHPFVSIYGPAQMSDGTTERVLGHGDAAWMRAHLTPMRRSEGLKLAPWLTGRGWTDLRGVRDETTGDVYLTEAADMLWPSHFYACDVYDHEGHRCTDYENRPSMCRGFPWYGSAPDPTRSLPATCSYLADIGKPVAEVPVVMGRGER